jgi:hypothetical protein
MLLENQFERVAKELSELCLAGDRPHKQGNEDRGALDSTP